NEEEYRVEVIKRVKEMADYSASFEIKCCHENEKGVYGKTAANCLDLRESVGENLGLIFDPANFIECDEDVNVAYETLEKYLTNMHLKDIVKESGEIVPCGDGDANIEILLKRFAKQLGTRFLTIEPHLNAFDGLATFDKETVEKLSEKKNKYKSLSESFAVACNAAHKILNTVQPIRLGIIGMGNMGGNHFRNYCNGELHEIRITAVADLKKDRLDAIKDKAFGIKFYNSDEELINSGEVDAVIIAVPHYQHLEIAKKAMLKGLHVMVEKPAGVYAKAVREFDEFCKGRKEVAALMLNQRTNHTFRKAKELIESGKFGEIKRVVWIITDWYRTEQYYRSGGWRATWGGEGGGVLLNQAPHNLDLWQWLCGMPNKIRAFCHEG
ncbi:MAG: Gfo/Idh/MocA family oxidoreductase, partial [Clostridia bacterium]